MKKYNIYVEKTLIRSGYVSIKANSAEEAREKAKIEYDDDELYEDDEGVSFSIESVIDLGREKKILTLEEILSSFDANSVKCVTEDYVFYHCYIDLGPKTYVRFKNVDGISLMEEKEEFKELINLFNSDKKIMDLSFEKLIEFESFTSEDSLRYYLQGIYLDKYNKNIVATDGRIVNIEYKEELNNCSHNYIIPKSIIETIYNDIEIYDLNKENRILIKVKNGDFEYDIITDVIGAEYPNYKKTVPEETEDDFIIDLNKKIPEKYEYKNYRIHLSEDKCLIIDRDGNILEENNYLSLRKDVNIKEQDKKQDPIEFKFNLENLNKLYRAGATYLRGGECKPLMYREEAKKGGNLRKALIIMTMR
jgi:hypothetical protein